MQDRYTSSTGVANLLNLSCNSRETFDQCPFVSKFGVTLARCWEDISAQTSWMVIYALQSHAVAQAAYAYTCGCLNKGVMP